MTATKQLDKFIDGHKARSISIYHDNGYGASCWVVELYSEYGKCGAMATQFTGCDTPKYFAYVDNDVDRDDWDWPTLDQTIKAALEQFRLQERDHKAE